MRINAKFPGRCCVCGKTIAVGQSIEYAKGQPTRHAACTPPEIPADAVHLYGGSGCGCEGWTPGEVINHQGTSLFILTASRQYYREDAIVPRRDLCH